MPLPLEPHASGEEVRDLHRRLASAGYPSHTDTLDRYGAETVAAVCAFQLARGLASTGTCDMATWSHLVEAGSGRGSRDPDVIRPDALVVRIDPAEPRRRRPINVG